MAEIFKAYDIRGRYPTDLDETRARTIAGAVGRFLGGGAVAVGHDVRHSAPSIAAAVTEGLRGANCRVVSIGLSTTPMLYFAVGHLGLAGGVMVTASHNPPDDIGLKVCREQAIPVGEDSGLREIKADSNAPVPEPRGSVERADVVPAYFEHIRRAYKPGRPIRFVVDCASGSVAPFFERLFGPGPYRVLCGTPDGRFPNHEPDPLKDKNIVDIAAAVRESGAELGIAFDGDGDRCMFLDAEGKRVPSDLVTILLARQTLAEHPGASIVYDLRSSRAVPEEIACAGGKPVRERVGHAFIKQTMRRTGARLGGELSGHFYFIEHFFADSGLMACAKILSIVGSGPETLAERVKPYRRYHASGEINYRVTDKAATMEALSRAFPRERQDRLDGVTVQSDAWWFNVRPSNTEPLLRLNLEADTAERLAAMRARLGELLGAPVS